MSVLTYKEAYELCLKKLKVHMEHMKDRAYELRGCCDGNYYDHKNGAEVENYWCWMASFTTGMGPIAYQTHKRKDCLAWAESFAYQYHDKVFETPGNAMHDLGFLYLPYSVAMYQVTGDRKHKLSALKAADDLAKRFHFKGHFIEAWDEMTKEDRECRGIVDTMMNLPLLLWAWKETSNAFYYEIAIRVLRMAARVFLREDGSVCHAFFFDNETGQVKAEANSCGYANGSHWARGTGWFVYGMAIAYSYTKEQCFLDAAEKAGRKFVECLTEEDGIPVWDFRLPEEFPATANLGDGILPDWDIADPANKVYNRDSSAAAIMTCAFQLLYRLTEDAYFDEHAHRMLGTLCEKYVNPDEATAGILTHVEGNMEYDSYADYYFMQALASEVYKIRTCWDHL